MFNEKRFTTLVLMVGLTIGSAAWMGIRASSALAADEKKEETWTKADYARDARAHLKKAHEEMVRIADKGNTEADSRDVEKARRAIDDALGAVDSYLEKVDNEKKAK